MTTTELLKFYLEAGADEAIGDHPVNRFAPPPAAQASAAAPNSAAARKAPTAAALAPASLTEAVKSAQEIARGCDSITALKSAIENFTGCGLRKTASKTVFAEGDPSARLMIIDRPPSADEDLSGLPFSGAQGQLLEKMLGAIGLGRDQVYLGGSLPWRPPGGRPATKEETALCLPFVERHIALAAPEILVLCGESAAMLLKQKTAINGLRGRWHDYDAPDPKPRSAIRAFPMFHPAFLLKHPSSKKLAWADLKAIKAGLE